MSLNKNFSPFNVFPVQNTMYLNHCFALYFVYQSNQQKNTFCILLFVQGKHKISHGLVKRNFTIHIYK